MADLRELRPGQYVPLPRPRGLLEGEWDMTGYRHGNRDPNWTNPEGIMTAPIPWMPRLEGEPNLMPFLPGQQPDYRLLLQELYRSRQRPDKLSDLRSFVMGRGPYG